MRKLIAISAALMMTTAVYAVTPQMDNKAGMKAQVTKSEARSIALKTVPGKIVSEELEKEKGGSGLRYSFDIVAKGVTHEVGVDARDGKVLENSIDNGND